MLQLIQYFPTISVGVFILIFLYGSRLYPGGSQAHQHDTGFSWRHNYWCDLMDSHGYNGKVNPARRISVWATLIMCLGIAVLFYQIPSDFGANEWQSLVIRGFGIGSALMASLIFTSWHNQVIGIGSLMALIALTLVFVILYKGNYMTLFNFGIICCVVMVLNNYIYYSKNGLQHLPWIQKISIAIVLTWVILLNMEGINLRS
ncbi:MAG: hypothetical protein KJP00_00255 [Bacteroidia bacterium]|nr:hypothetical protein [Bacteroidia bacterium]